MCRTSERIPMIRFLDDGTHPGARGSLQSIGHPTVHQTADLVSQPSEVTDPRFVKNQPW